VLCACPGEGRGASPSCICAEILPLRCYRPMLTDALQGLCRRRGIWRSMTLALRVVWCPVLGCGRTAAVGQACLHYRHLAASRVTTLWSSGRCGYAHDDQAN
jgi:hypothetical protein